MTAVEYALNESDMYGKHILSWVGIRSMVIK